MSDPDGPGRAADDTWADEPLPSPAHHYAGLPVPVYTVDPAGAITWYNGLAAELWGRAPTAADRYCGAHRLFTPAGDPVPADRCFMALALAHDATFAGQPLVVERPDGGRVTVLFHARPLHDPHGRQVGGVNVMVPVADPSPAADGEPAAGPLRAAYRVLRDAVVRGRPLGDVVPICAHCKAIRRDDHRWQTLEEYLHERTGAGFTHGICPQCLTDHYADLLCQRD